MKRILTIVLALALCLSLAACGQEQAAAPNEPKGTIKVGILNEGSGALATWGANDLKGLMCGFEYFTDENYSINGYKLELVVEDTGGDTATAVSKATKLIEEDEVDFLIGTISSGVAAAVMPVAVEYEVPYIITGAAADDITGAWFNEYTFRIGRTVSMASVAGMAVVDNIKGTTWGIFGPQTVAGQSGNEALQTALEDLGATVVYNEVAPADCQDFSAYAAKIKTANPQFLTATLVGNNYTIVLPRQLREAGVLESTSLVVSIVDFATIEGLGDSGVGMIGECIYHYNLYDNEYNDALIETHKNLYNGEMPDYWAGESFTAAHAACLAIDKITAAGNEVSTENMIGALEGLKFDDIKGSVELRAADHQLLQGMPVGEIVKDANGGYSVNLYRWVPAEEITPEITAPGR